MLTVSQYIQFKYAKIKSVWRVHHSCFICKIDEDYVVGIKCFCSNSQNRSRCQNVDIIIEHIGICTEKLVYLSLPRETGCSFTLRYAIAADDDTLLANKTWFYSQWRVCASDTLNFCSSKPGNGSCTTPAITIQSFQCRICRLALDELAGRCAISFLFRFCLPITDWFAIICTLFLLSVVIIIIIRVCSLLHLFLFSVRWYAIGCTFYCVAMYHLTFIIRFADIIPNFHRVFVLMFGSFLLYPVYC